MTTHLAKDAHIYFLGIGGTGMASVAGLCQQAGFRVSGSDAGVYPPMSTMLAELNIPFKTPYSPDNLSGAKPDLYVIANVLSRGHAELEAALSSGVPYTSFPQLLGDAFLSSRVSCVVTGTHGKTTTTSLLSHVLFVLGEDPSFIVGGIPRNFPRSMRLGQSPLFVIEGDEYDTAFFDKGPKFLHYHPKHLLLNNLEYDHADIYPNLEAIAVQFRKVVALVEGKSRIIANIDDAGIRRLVEEMGIERQVLRVATLGEDLQAEVCVLAYKATALDAGTQRWTAEIKAGHLGPIAVETNLSGRHNLANIAQVIGTLLSLEKSGDLKNPLTVAGIASALKSFQNVQRRLDLLLSQRGIDVYEDFAHHPTAVRLVIEGFRAAYPDKRLLVAFEPRSASQRRTVFQAAFAAALGLADRIFIGECFQDQRIPAADRLNTETLAKLIGTSARSYQTNAELLRGLRDEVAPGDAVIFMSSGSFSGVQHQLVKELKVAHE